MFPCYVESGAVKGRSPDERQAERQVHSGPVAGQFKRDHRLVMIHRKNAIVHACGCLCNRNISTERAADPGEPAGPDGRTDNCILLIADNAVIRTMGIYAQDNDLRFSYAEQRAQRIMGRAQGRAYVPAVQLPADRCQRHVPGHEAEF